MKNANIYNLLSEPFSPDVERQLKKGGVSLTYIPVSEVITRLNKVLGVDTWSFNIISCERDSLDPDYIVAHVRLMWQLDSEHLEKCIIRDGFGGQKVKRTKAGDIVDLGDEYKGAVSDALKKAAQAFGVGLYLARSEDAILEEIAKEVELSKEPLDPVVVELWDSFVSLSKAMNAEQKKELNEFWNTVSNGAAKPTKQTATISDLEILIEKSISLSMENK